MELQRSLPDFERAEVALFAISYDSVAVLAAFAAKYGIGYELLADEGSRVIREPGLLTEHLDQQHAHYGVQTRPEMWGVAYPGVFVLDDRGVIVDKRFEQSYRVRPSAVLLAEEITHETSTVPDARAPSQTDELRVTAWLGSQTYRPYQKLRLNVALHIASDLHVFASPVPPGYTPLILEIESSGEPDVGLSHLPPGRPFTVEGLDERFLVYDDTVTGWIPLAFFKNHGETTVVVRLRYQACSPTTCYPPREVSLSLLLTGLDNVRD